MDKSKFLKVKCPRCKHEVVVFGKASTLVKCAKCNWLLLKTQGGKAKINAPVHEIL